MKLQLFVRTYLRSRRDFVRYIVTSLMDGGSFELSEDLSDVGEAEDAAPASGDEWRQWLPDIVHATTQPS